MKRGIQVFILFFIVVTLTNCKKADTSILYDKKYVEEIKQVRKELSFYMRNNFIPGAQIAISKNGKIIYSEGIGLASKDLEVSTTRDTKFRIGSLSELYTTLIYLKMVEDGTLIPDSTIQHYLPEFPKKRLPITLDNLKNHTSGIRQLNSRESKWRGINVSLQKGLEIFQDDELMAPPGNFQQESRLNFNLLGAIMEEASGKKFNTLLKEYVTDTLHFENTAPDNPFATIKGRTDFYDHNMIAQVTNALTIDMRWRAPSDGLLSSAEDLVKLTNIYLSSDYLNDSTRAHLFEPVMLNNNQQSQFANGWIILHDREGNIAYGREGFVHGGSSAVLIYPDEELIIALTTNLTQERANSPVFKLAHIFLPKTEEAEE
ncbi:serine hydrolase domain-containing protein [Draconibacterium halophilum]|uniref:Beta-lactamase family protein n=1 Tax=Draconibacterium halophilum TaxID=2706887 RepID=A0A6C0REG1_9BACT|nr:serine hydrolase domain-containing protein [Draconibacterium halophilum]QIA08770.1 beta-lactamase family protein [Draconibacterium halophilum]